MQPRPGARHEDHFDAPHRTVQVSKARDGLASNASFGQFGIASGSRSYFWPGPPRDWLGRFAKGRTIHVLALPKPGALWHVSLQSGGQAMHDIRAIRDMVSNQSRSPSDSLDHLKTAGNARSTPALQSRSGICAPRIRKNIFVRARLRKP